MEKTSDDLFSQLIQRGVEAALDKYTGRPLNRVQRLLTLEPAAEYLCLTPEALKIKHAHGLIRAVRIDRRLRFDIRDLDELIERSKESS